MSAKNTKSSPCVGARCRSLRERHGYTIEGLAHAAGLHPNTVAGIERGEKNARIDTLIALARGLEVDVSALMPRGD